MRRIVKPGQKPTETTKQQLDAFWHRKFNITQFLFDKQLAFVEDPNPFKIAVCSRRAGKTVACAAHLIDAAVKTPNVVCLYITLSRNNAKKIIWRDLKNIIEKHELKAVPDNTELSWTFPNGSVIYLSGAKDESEIEKFRGLSVKLCYIDECQSFKAYIQELINDIIAPSLIDYAGTLALIGTPGPIPAGFFYECSQSENWSKHHWTFWDNMFIVEKSGSSHQQLFDRELKRRGTTAADPSIQREWFGKWVLDSDSLLIKYDSNKNNWAPPLPITNKYNYILGIDVGFMDADALAVLAWSESDPVTYLVEEIVTPKQGLSELVDQVNYIQKKYDISKMIMDMGGLGKKIGEEMIRRYHIPVEAADKTRKMENIELLNDALRRGHFKAPAKSRFAQDSYLVEIDRDKSTPDRIKVSDRFHSDIIDSVLYAFKFSPAYAYSPEPEKPKYGSKAWAEAQTKAMWEAAMDHFESKQLTKAEYGDYND